LQIRHFLLSFDHFEKQFISQLVKLNLLDENSMCCADATAFAV